MPTENNGIVPGKVFMQTNENEELKELQCCKIEANTMDDKADATRYAVEGMQRSSSITVTISRESSMYLQKMLGIQRITRKRFIKLLMGCGIQRNDAEVIAEAFHENRIQFTPLAVQRVFETIIKEAEKM